VIRELERRLVALIRARPALRHTRERLDHQRQLAVAMTGADALIDVGLGDALVGDFHRLAKAISLRRARPL
jgi:hypothetical protein